MSTTLGCAIGSQVNWAAAGGFSIPQHEGRIYCALKWDMIQEPLSVLDKFRLCKELGYDGIELYSPINVPVKEVLQAIKQTELPVHGMVNAKLWRVRLSSPDEKIQAQATEILKQAVRDCHGVGGFSVLVIPGQVTGSEESHEHVWHRSIKNIRQVLPLASRLGIRLLIENVWNGFCETPEQLCDYLDEFDSPWVGSYFDIGNVVKFSPSQDWIRKLGSRIVKLDVKDWSQEGGFCKIGDGNVDWPEVRKALSEIRFAGWGTSEVAGGNRERLTEILQRMHKAVSA